MSNADWGKAVFEEDIKAIRECDQVVCIYYGLYSDSGTAWECGFAYGIDKPVILYDAAGDEVVGAPELAVGRDVILFAVLRLDQMQRLLVQLRLVGDVIRHGVDILDELLRVVERHLADALQNVLPAVRAGHAIGAVDMSVAE